MNIETNNQERNVAKDNLIKFSRALLESGQSVSIDFDALVVKYTTEEIIQKDIDRSSLGKQVLVIFPVGIIESDYEGINFVRDCVYNYKNQEAADVELYDFDYMISDTCKSTGECLSGECLVDVKYENAYFSIVKEDNGIYTHTVEFLF